LAQEATIAQAVAVPGDKESGSGHYAHFAAMPSRLVWVKL